MTFSGRFVISMIRFASNQGVSPQELVALLPFTESELCEDDVRVDADVYNNVAETIVQKTGDQAFGLHLGEALNLSAAGLIAQITQTSRTVKEALEYCCEFANLGCRALPITMEEESDCYRVTFSPDPIWKKKSSISVRHTIDGVVAFTLREFYSLTHRKHYPLSIHFSYPQPEDSRAHHSVLQCPLFFDAEVTSIRLDKAQVETPVITSDYDLLRILVKHAREKVMIIEQEQGFAQVVRGSILNMLKPQFPSIEQVAENLNLSVRTLQRKLKEEQKTFKALLDELRHEMALDYLSKPDLTVNDVAYLLSYTEASTFIRAFKRRMGLTPHEFRSGKKIRETA